MADEILNEKVKEETISVDYVDNKMLFKTLKKTKEIKKKSHNFYGIFLYLLV
jgi:hypothetical protein